MFEEILKEFLGTTKTFDDLINEVFDNKVNTDDVSNEKNHSYFHSVKDKYKNGEHVSHSEKEIKDGKVIKDVNNSVSLEDKKNCTCNENVCKCNENVCKCDRKLYEKKETEYDALKGINKHLEQSLKSAENALIEKDKKIAELESKLYEVTKDKNYLLNKFEEIKNAFKIKLM